MGSQCKRKKKKKKTSYQDTRNKLPWVRVSSKKKKNSLKILEFSESKFYFKWSRRPGLKQDGRLSVSNYQGMKIDDYNCKVELALTSDVRTIVCYRPSVDIPYEHTKLQVKTSFFLLLPAYPSAGSCAYSSSWRNTESSAKNQIGRKRWTVSARTNDRTT